MALTKPPGNILDLTSIPAPVEATTLGITGAFTAGTAAWAIGTDQIVKDVNGKFGFGTDDPQATLDVSLTDNFKTAHNDFSGDGLHIQSSGTGGVGNYGGGISFSRLSADNNTRSAGIASYQSGSDADQSGLALFTHPSAVTGAPLVAKVLLDHEGRLLASSGITLGNGTTYAADKTMDDYEEGNFTALLSDGTNTNATYVVQVGTYTKIGNKVHVQGYLSTSELGSISGDVRISGLPFAAANVTSSFSAASIGFASGLGITAGLALTASVQPNTTAITLRVWNASGGTF